MISRKTVFVLGAGAHCSYGFPNGRKLKQDVVAVVKQGMLPDSLRSFLQLPDILGMPQGGLDHEQLSAFAIALEQSGQPSIDAYLNANRHLPNFEIIGKAGIAQVLLDCEKKSYSSDDDWLSYVFEIMIDGVDNPEDFVAKNRLSFITFNYDRFLENWLATKIQYSFGMSRQLALKFLEKIPIHHVYGSLGSIDLWDEPVEKVWPQASRGIRTIFDVERHDDQIDRSKELLHAAEIVCLLGYGFHRENTALLGMLEILNRAECAVASSCYELMPVEWRRITTPFSNAGIQINISMHPHKCLAALRHLAVF